MCCGYGWAYRPIADFERVGWESGVVAAHTITNRTTQSLPVFLSLSPSGSLSLWSMVTLRLVVGSGVDSGRGCFRVSAAASGRGVDWLALDLDVGLLRGAGRGPGAHPLLDLGRHSHEGLLHVGGALGAGLQEGDPQVVCKFLVNESEYKEESDKLDSNWADYLLRKTV